jgi:hypothetical protein
LDTGKHLLFGGISDLATVREYYKEQAKEAEIQKEHEEYKRVAERSTIGSIDPTLSLAPFIGYCQYRPVGIP